MSQVTSGLKIQKIDGNDVIIRTQTTYDENDPNSPSSVKETQIQVAIDEDDYNSLSSDLQGGAASGRFYAIIKKTTRNSDGTFNEVYSDRGAYKYHGRVKTFAETLRKNGLKF